MEDFIKKEIKDLKLGEYGDIHFSKTGEDIVTISTTAFAPKIAYGKLNILEEEIGKVLSKNGYYFNLIASYKNETNYPNLIRYNRKLKIYKIENNKNENKPKTFTDEFGTHPINDFGEIQYDLNIDEN